jgi:hypothetical protein
VHGRVLAGCSETPTDQPRPPVEALTSANEWVAAWVSTPMTNAYSSATMGIATEFLPIGDVVSASPRERTSRQACNGHNSRQRVGQASHQATEARPGPCRPPRSDGQILGRAPHRTRRFRSLTQSGRQHRSCQPAPRQPCKNLQMVQTGILGQFPRILLVEANPSDHHTRDTIDCQTDQTRAAWPSTAWTNAWLGWSPTSQ